MTTQAPSFERVLARVSDAVDYVRAQGGRVEDPTVVEQTQLGSPLRELPDSAPIEHACDEQLAEPAPYQIRASSVHEFLMIYEALEKIHWPISKRKIDSDISHENAHMDMVRALGFKQAEFEVSLYYSSDCYRAAADGSIEQDCEFRWRPATLMANPTRTITKLALASIIAAPRRPSNGDIARLNAMGYECQADVHQRLLIATDDLTFPSHTHADLLY